MFLKATYHQRHMYPTNPTNTTAPKLGPSNAFICTPKPLSVPTF